MEQIKYNLKEIEALNPTENEFNTLVKKGAFEEFS